MDSRGVLPEKKEMTLNNLGWNWWNGRKGEEEKG